MESYYLYMFYRFKKIHYGFYSLHVSPLRLAVFWSYEGFYETVIIKVL